MSINESSHSQLVEQCTAAFNATLSFIDTHKETVVSQYTSSYQELLDHHKAEKRKHNLTGLLSIAIQAAAGAEPESIYAGTADVSSMPSLSEVSFQLDYAYKEVAHLTTEFILRVSEDSAFARFCYGRFCDYADDSISLELMFLSIMSRANKVPAVKTPLFLALYGFEKIEKERHELRMNLNRLFGREPQPLPTPVKKQPQNTPPAATQTSTEKPADFDKVPISGIYFLVGVFLVVIIWLATR